MIFYDQTQRRRRLVRLVFSAFVVVVIGTSLYFFQALQASRAGAAAIEREAFFEPAKKIVLTFDDGPHPTYTRQVMDILEANHVPATFFFLGSNILKYPEVAKEAYDRGFEVGNHTFTHSRSVHESKERISSELNFTDKILRQTIGRSPILYRPPYLLDVEDDDQEIVTRVSAETGSALRHIDELGYITVGSWADSIDWKAKTPEEVVENALRGIPGGHVILLHDNEEGGYPTVAALPSLIAELRSRGYEFVTVADLIGLTRDEAMPLPPTVSLVDRVQDTFFAGVAGQTQTLPPLLLFTLLVITVFRIVFLLTLAAVRPLAQRQKTINREPYRGGVSVLVPAYNEAENIEGTLKSIAQSTHYPREIIVIDDGSKDATSERVRSIARQLGEDITLVRKVNAGKAIALNAGLKRAKYDVFVAIDGDTVIHKDALAHLAARFVDPKVGAVAGKIEAVGVRNWIQAFQNLEYTVSQNIDKSVFSSLGAVGVIPGAIGAWRKSDVVRAGGYTNDTLVEDQDLTLAIHALGKTVAYEPRAVAYTEVPKNTRNFFKQRFRWVFGGLQCLWKYRTSFLSYRSLPLGWIILPYNLIYTFVVPTLQLVSLAAVFLFIASAKWEVLFAGFVLFFVIDIIYAAAGLLNDPKKASLLWHLPLQRTYYATLAMVIMFLSLVKIVEGTRALWNRFERTGSAQKFFEEVLSGLPLPRTVGATNSLPIR